MKTIFLPEERRFRTVISQGMTKGFGVPGPNLTYVVISDKGLTRIHEVLEK
jgi:hypothetical protein